MGKPKMPADYGKESLLSTSSAASAIRWARIARAEMADENLGGAVFSLRTASMYAGLVEGEWLAAADRYPLKRMWKVRDVVTSLATDLGIAVDRLSYRRAA